jgi:hypothetical protein
MSEVEERKATETVLRVILRHRDRLSDLIEEDDETIKRLRAMLDETENELALAGRTVNTSSSGRAIGTLPPGSLGTPTGPPLLS